MLLMATVIILKNGENIESACSKQLQKLVIE